MLMNIDPDQIDDVKRILTWLCFSKRPVTMQEIVEGLAVDIGENPRLDAEGRLEDTDDIVRMCPGLISISTVKAKAAFAPDSAVQSPVVRIAHFSVQEYLESDRITSRQFALFSRTANEDLAKICIVYMRYVELKSLDDYPLALYAAKHWHEHLLDADRNSDSINLLVTEFLQSAEDGIGRSIKIHDLEMPSGGISLDREPGAHIYYASLLGLYRPLQILLEDTSIRSTINNSHGLIGTPLAIASDMGHERVIQLLLANGAKVDVEGQENAPFGPALHRASLRGHEKVVQLLLDNGAEVNRINRSLHENAIHLASAFGHKKVVELLLDRGADINAQEGFLHSPLQVASDQGHEQIVRLLLERGAEIRTEEGFFGSALQAASYHGYEQIVQLLLEEGAEVDAREGFLGSALRAAAATGHAHIVQLLLEGGADIDVQGGADITSPGCSHGSALQAALHHDQEQVVQLLLDKGAKDDGSLLYDAAAMGRGSIMQRMLEKGFEISTSKAIQMASMRGNAEMVQMLLALDRGSEITNDVVNISAEEFPVQLQLDRSADMVGERIQAMVHVVSGQGNTDVVPVVLTKAVKLDSSAMGAALQAVAERGNMEVAQMLLDSGVKIDSHELGVALMIASRQGKIQMALLLLERGAATGIKVVQAALEEAAEWGSKDLVRALLDTGFNIDTSKAIKVASRTSDHKELVSLLQDSGVQIDVKIMEVGTEEASGWGHERVV
jgi:ankyrin repeat protein